MSVEDFDCIHILTNGCRPRCFAEALGVKSKHILKYEKRIKDVMKKRAKTVFFKSLAMFPPCQVYTMYLQRAFCTQYDLSYEGCKVFQHDKTL